MALPMTGHAVVIVGGGPTGMMLAGEVALPNALTTWFGPPSAA